MNEFSSADALLDGLDEQQRQAARTLLGPVCLLAGAGTGKTRAITHRIAYGVATGVYPPGRVLALTFTTRAAGELRSRLRVLGAHGVMARTFHAAALSQLNFFWPQVIGGSMPRLVESKASLIAHAAESIRLKLDTPTLRDVAAEIEWRKVSRLSIGQYANATGRAVPPALSLETLADLHSAYESIKDERRQLDFEDVLLAAAGMIESEPFVAEHVREQYRFFVVDEYQDVSRLQHDLLTLWLGERNDVCVVGDASQTIYSFAGASPRYLLDFGREHANAVVLRLEQNYRSVPPIIDSANRLMQGRAGALALRPTMPRTAEPALPSDAADAGSRREAGASTDVPVVAGHASDAIEARAIAQEIAARISAGAPAQSIAILYRINVQSAIIEAALTDAGVGYQLRGSSRFFDQREVRDAIMMLKGAAVSVRDEPLFKTVSDVLRSLGWTQEAPETRGAVRDRWESLNALMGLAEAAPADTSLSGFVAELMDRQAAHHEPTVQAVTLATLHSAKGLEWDHVYIVGLVEGLLPISFATAPGPGAADAIDEERRLLYVGVTRARRSLSLSWAARGQNRTADRRPSRFLAELGIRNPGEAMRG